MGLCSARVSGLGGRASPGGSVNCGSCVGLCHPTGKERASHSTDLCYFHIYFQQIETELRQMELIKDQYQKKNYEQVDDFHKLCLPFT